MRLIDADNLKATEGMFIYQTEDRDTVVAVEAYRWELIEREAPTVKAIPIDWIKKYYTDITSPYTDTRIQFEEMIRKWEAENETN